jgi:hypothetical protein
MQPVSIRLYWMGVTGNVLALVALLHGLFIHRRAQERALSIVLTRVSVICWLLYFRVLHG